MHSVGHTLWSKLLLEVFELFEYKAVKLANYNPESGKVVPRSPEGFRGSETSTTSARVASVAEMRLMATRVSRGVTLIRISSDMRPSLAVVEAGVGLL